MAGLSRFKFSFTLVVLFGLLAVSSSSAFDEDEEELRGFEEDRSAESEENLRDYRYHYQWQRPAQFVPQHHYGHYQQQNQQYVKVPPQMPKCNNLPQCKPCKAPTVPSYQPKPQSARLVQQRNYFEEQESQSEEEYETRYYNQHYYYQTTQPPRRPRQCSDVCKPPSVPVTKKPYVQPVQPNYQQQYQQYQHQYQHQYRPSGYGR